MPRKSNAMLATGFAAASFLVAGTASAAEIRWIEDERGDVITIEGELVSGDEVAFAKAIKSLQNATVILNSPGGDLAPGLEIGMAIREAGFDTLVPDGAECASACALAWMGGESRAMGDRGSVGFHAAYVEVGNRAEETGAGNAVIGAYLHELGLSFDTIFFLTSSPPEDMYWLTFDDAEELGIEVEHSQIAALPDQHPNTGHPNTDRPSKG